MRGALVFVGGWRWSVRLKIREKRLITHNIRHRLFLTTEHGLVTFDFGKIFTYAMD